jgi:predicted nucleic acid-binding protein
VTLTDAGPLIAIIDADEPDHVACMEALDQIVIPLVTTWPAFTEAMYLLAGAGGIRAQRAFWRLVRTDRLAIADLSPSAVDRSARLIDQYADRPMDLADATLVALAEEQGDRRINHPRRRLSDLPVPGTTALRDDPSSMTHGLCATLCVQWQVTVHEGAGQGRVDLKGQLSNPPRTLAKVGKL